MKRNIFAFLLCSLALGFFPENASAIETIPEEVVSDLYYHDSVYLRNLEYPEDLGASSGESTAGIEGTGTVVIGRQKTGGFPRLILFGGTDVTSSRTFSSGSGEWWDGELKTPEKMIRPSVASISFENPGAHRGSRLKVIDAYQFGSSNEEFSFSQEAYAIFNLGIKDGIKVWIARGSADSSLSVADEDYCVVKDGLCSIELDGAWDQMVFVTKSYFDCPPERVENGSYGSLPECAVACDPGYVLDYNELSCVRPYNLDEEETSFRAEFAQRYDLFTDRARQGYFRYRDTRGSQLEQVDSEGLNETDRKFVERKNLNNSARKNGTTSSMSVQEKSLWEAIKDLKFDIWNEGRKNSKANRPMPSGNGESYQEEMMEGELQMEEESAQGESQTFAGGILPRTGPGAFLALVIAGVALMGFARRRR